MSFRLLRYMEACRASTTTAIMARSLYTVLRQHFMCEFDDHGNVGKRYRRQDEIGTPYCITVDFQSLDDDTVTVRDRDSMLQERVQINELRDYLRDRLE